jgi:glutamyl-Q tRNA(Asp) synthetase
MAAARHLGLDLGNATRVASLDAFYADATAAWAARVATAHSQAQRLG